jgi:hypothetical protein
MKQLIAFCVCSLLVVSAWGFETVWQDNGISVRKGGNFAWNGQTTVTNDGKIVHVWSDSRGNDCDVWAQAYNIIGQPLWGDQPVLVGSGARIQDNPQVVLTTDGGVMIAWMDHSIGFEPDPIYVQKLNLAGMPQWQEGGVVFYGTETAIWDMTLTAETNGGAYLSWMESTNDGDRYSILRVDSDGGSPWNDSYPVFDDGFQGRLVPDGQGGLMVALLGSDGIEIHHVSQFGGAGLVQTIPFIYDTSDLFCERLTGGGYSLAWRQADDSGHHVRLAILDAEGQTTSGPLSVTSGAGTFTPKALLAEGDDSYLVWADQTQGENFWASRFGPTGSPVWASPVLIEDPLLTYDTRYAHVLTDGDGGFYMTVSNYEETQHIIVQHLSATGEKLWGDAGVEIPLDCGFVTNRISLVKTQERLLVTYDDIEGCNDVLRMQEIENNGAQVFENGGVVIRSMRGGQVDSKQTFVGGGVTYVLWKEEYGRMSRLFLQGVRNDGTICFADNGIQVACTSCINGFAGVSDDNGLVGFVYMKLIDGYDRLYFQAVDPSGALLYGTNGISVSDMTAEQNSPQIVCWGANDFTVIWGNIIPGEFMFYYDTYGQRFIGGQPAWESPGKLIAHADQLDAMPTRAFERYVVWRDNYNLHVIRIDYNGDPADGWVESGLQVSNTEDADLMQAMLNGLGGIDLLWEESEDVLHRFRFQEVRVDGSPVWEGAGTTVTFGPGNESYMNMAYDGQLYFCYSKINDPYCDYGIISTNTELGGLWEDTIMSDPTGDQHQTLMFPMCNDQYSGVATVIPITGCAQTSCRDLYMQYTTCEGANTFAQAIPLVEEVGEQCKPEAISNCSSSAVITWIDGRSMRMEGNYGDIYAQRVVEEITDGSDNHAPAARMTLGNFPNPFNPTTAIGYSLPVSDRAVLRIYNARGQLIRKLVDETLPAGDHLVTWNGDDDSGRPVSTGVYFYRLESHGNSIVKKCLLMK